ncbi:MAG TPA: xanthine dehydrogenase family protein molybdopterin-binding subunit [Spirochaetia bacterium]|nr:xanthine dehydrogenase family protein molybdopterin-binding subunit [Spirochaetia bacterium]
MSAEWIGKSPRRVGGFERVTGAQQFLADIRLDGTLSVRLVHVDCGHAKIIEVDTSEAAKVPGVHRVLTAADLPQPVPRFGPTFQDRPVIAVDEAKFFGEPVAAVAAETDDAAQEAAAQVRVRYEELRGVYTIDDALDSGAPLVQDPSLRPKDPLRNTNTLEELKFGWGDVEKAHADVVVEDTYTFPMVTHFAIEPYAFMAAPDGDGIRVWSPIQHPFILQRIIADVLELPLAKVRIFAPDPGGGFGGKGYPKFEPLLAFLALKTGRPVRLVLTLEESFQAGRRMANRVRVRSGFLRNGSIVFHDIMADCMIGAYVDIAARVVEKASYTACGPYRVPNARILSRALLSHTTPSTAFRGFGVPQMSWAVESQLDEAARKLGIDRVEIRLRNLPRKGEVFIPGDLPCDGNWDEALRKAAAAVDWGSPLARGRGRGIALGLKISATYAASYVVLRLHYDGSATLMTGTSDMGQGARTVFSQIVAHEMGIPLSQVAVVMGDTAVVPYDTSTSASRSTVIMGTAVFRACQELKAQIRRLAADTLSASENEVVVDRGVIHGPKGDLTFLAFLRDFLGSTRGELIAVGQEVKKKTWKHPLAGTTVFYELSCTAAEVEVDTGTGMILIHTFATVGDVGKALNPQHVEMQDGGAAVMGLGHTLMEHLILDASGRIRNLGALDYRIPTIKDLPLQMHSLAIENEDGPGPYGSKGTGEGGLLATSPAVGSAVQEATGVKIRDLPLTPERIWQGLQDHVRGR